MEEIEIQYDGGEKWTIKCPSSLVKECMDNIPKNATDVKHNEKEGEITSNRDWKDDYKEFHRKQFKKVEEYDYLRYCYKRGDIYLVYEWIHYENKYYPQPHFIFKREVEFKSLWDFYEYKIEKLPSTINEGEEE